MRWCAACETDAEVRGGRCVLCGEPASGPDTARRATPAARPVARRGPSGVVIVLAIAAAFVTMAFVSVLAAVAFQQPSSRPTIQVTDYVPASEIGLPPGADSAPAARP
ncbi:hypothetical protein HJ588_05960 [Flexivirga sp. ID2601S]|uniref:Uncharacterized protein n=1 Tax=Flexivirga aerilata TaxID=1656889 RepID=A0A849AEF6_9MICO|nr:hypothetical protein [Flexivirga aerilata]NNG38819.1 hypothetical protein [Flexivirga aerilata]